MLSMDLHDGFHAVGIAPEDRDYLTVNYRGKLYRLMAGLPMGWSMSPYYFRPPTAALNRHLQRPDFAVTSQGAVRRAKLRMGRRQALHSHFRGCRMLPYCMDDFMFFATSRTQATMYVIASPPPCSTG
eukprot:jgi/Tetstr1/440437/TSEL_028770.t1